MPHPFEWFDGAGVGAPTTGAGAFVERPSLHADMFHIFSDAFAPACPAHLTSLLWANSGAPPAPCRRWPATVRYVGRPPDGPERSPLARVWRALKDDLAWGQFPDLEAPQASVGDLLRADDATALQSLTGYADVVEAMNALC